MSRLLHFAQERECEHLDEGECLDRCEGEDEEPFSIKMLLDGAEEVFYLPSSLVVEEDRPGLLGILHLDVGQEHHGFVEALGEDEHKEEGQLRMVGQAHLLEGDGRRECLLQFAMLPLLGSSRGTPDLRRDLLYRDGLITHLLTTHEMEMTALLAALQPRHEAPVQHLRAEEKPLLVVSSPVFHRDDVTGATETRHAPFHALFLLLPGTVEAVLQRRVQVMAERRLPLRLQSVRDAGECRVAPAHRVPLAAIDSRADLLHNLRMWFLDIPSVPEEENGLGAERKGGMGDVLLCARVGVDLPERPAVMSSATACPIVVR